MIPRQSDPRVQRFLELIEVHFREGWGVEAYGRVLGISARHLNRLCRIETGLSAQQTIGAVNFSEACRLLVYTSMSVASVDSALGFGDLSYFT